MIRLDQLTAPNDGDLLVADSDGIGFLGSSSSTVGAVVPVGTAAQRPASPSRPVLRLETGTGWLETVDTLGSVTALRPSPAILHLVIVRGSWTGVPPLTWFDVPWQSENINVGGVFTYDSGTQTVTIGSSGTVMVGAHLEVTDFGGNTAGTLYMDLLRNGISIVPGTNYGMKDREWRYDGSENVKRTFAVWTFAANPGDQIVVRGYFDSNASQLRAGGQVTQAWFRML